jgi:C-terminal processing protease CtpA/Prc
VLIKVLVPGRNGNLGNSVLKRFEMVWDYNIGAVYVKPSIYYNERFEYDMSGLEFSTLAPDFKRCIISRVAPNSPAEWEGIKPGDELLAINLKPIEQMSLNEITEYFKSGDDRNLFLEFIPKGSRESKKIIFTLKRRI